QTAICLGSVPTEARLASGSLAQVQRRFAARLAGRMRLQLHLSEMPVLTHCVSQRLSPRIGAAEDFQFAAPIIIEPFDAPFPGCCPIFKDLGGLGAGADFRTMLRFLVHARR